MVHVLVPVAILEGESPSAGLVELLGTVDVTVLGYHELPEQTPPDQARAQYEERAVEGLADLCEEFAAAGADADHRLVFTHDRRQSIDRVAGAIEADAYAHLGATSEVDRVLVPLSGDVGVDRIVNFVATLVGDRDVGVTLLLADDGELAAEADDATAADDGAAATAWPLEGAAERLADAGLDVTTRRAEGRPLDALVDALPGHDAIVMGERAPSLSSFLLGEEDERVAAASVGPVLVVRAPDDETED